MIKLCCYAKILFYVGLIVYHIVDFCVDWLAYHKLETEGTFSAIPHHNSVASVLFLASCISGTLSGVVMIVVYGYYIKHHRASMASLNRYSVRVKECDVGFVVLELAISLCEMVFKDGIQSALLFAVYNSDGEPNEDSANAPRLSKVFAVSAIVGNVKLFACFTSKLYGLGSGETCSSGLKCLACFLGSMCSLTFMYFASLYLAKMNKFAN